MIEMFVDLKVAFDMMDREILIGIMKKKGTKEGLIERVEMLRKTRSRIRVGRGKGKSF